MKRVMVTGAVVSAVIASLLPLRVQRVASVRAEDLQQASITGRISPQDGAEAIWIFGLKDSVRAVASSGNFSAQVKPGTHKLLVDAKAPYRDVVLDNLEVKDKQVLDIGEIILQQ